MNTLLYILAITLGTILLHALLSVIDPFVSIL